MPTGYTAGVADGTIKTFREFALTCARAFGACVMLKDEPLSSEIPEFEPCDYHSKELQKDERELAKILAASDEELRGIHDQEMQEKVRRAEKGLADNTEQLCRYSAMLQEAQRYLPPTPDHSALAQFMVSQLKESLSFDDSSDYWKREMQTIPFDEWKQTKLTKLKSGIERHKDEYKKDVERTNQRNKWVRDLKRSLEHPTEREGA